MVDSSGFESDEGRTTARGDNDGVRQVAIEGKQTNAYLFTCSAQTFTVTVDKAYRLVLPGVSTWLRLGPTTSSKLHVSMKGV